MSVSLGVCVYPSMFLSFYVSQHLCTQWPFACCMCLLVSVYLSICSPVSVCHNVCLTQCLYGPVLYSPVFVCATVSINFNNCMSQVVSHFLCVPMPVYLSVCIFQYLHVPLLVSQSVCVSQCFSMSLCLCASMSVSYCLCVPGSTYHCVCLSFSFCVLQSL